MAIKLAIYSTNSNQYGSGFNKVKFIFLTRNLMYLVNFVLKHHTPSLTYPNDYAGLF